jgi:hypothetical protein
MDIRDADQEAALNLSREINSNPRRRSSAILSPKTFFAQSSRPQTRASKRAQTNYEMSLTTSIPDSSIPAQPIGMDVSSSPLSSSPTSESTLPVDPLRSLIVRFRYSPGASITINKVCLSNSHHSNDFVLLVQVVPPVSTDSRSRFINYLFGSGSW